MNDDDLSDDIIFWGYAKDYIDRNTLCKWMACYPFYIKDEVDPYIEKWETFIDAAIDNDELPTYDLRPKNIKKWFENLEDFPNEVVEIRPIGPKDLYGIYIKKKEFFDLISFNYCLTSDDKYKEIMKKTLSQYEFMLEMFKNNIQQKDIDIQKICAEYKQTSKATQTRQENILKNWQQTFRYMIEIRDLIMKDGPAKRTERQLWKMFEDKGYEISKTQMTYFKTLLPDGYVDREGGAPRQ